jgi:N-methylhydantoinase A
MREIGIDVGGTFTDVYSQDSPGSPGSGESAFAKADTTDFDLKRGVLTALEELASKLGQSLEEMLGDAAKIVYSTTVGTNALLERKGPRLGIITTAGFDDTLAIGRGRSWADGLSVDKRLDRARASRPAPLVPAALTTTVHERVTSTGRVLVPLADDDARGSIRRLVDQGVQGFVVSLLYSYVYPAHEQRIRQLIREEYPEECLGHYPVILSCEASPEMGEYRRLTTCILDGFLRMMAEEHLLELSEELLARGYRRPLLVAKCTGGASSLSRTRPIHLYGSGPVAGITGGRRLATHYALDKVIITDMGGTSFDVGIVTDGATSSFDSDPVIDRWRVQVPVVAHWSIGAGGGSIAQVADGSLKVGPRSAHAMPGPACYGRGGYEPTVTDADVVLGYVDPDYFLGGRFGIDVGLANEAVREHVGLPTGKSAVEAAWDIKHLVDGIMGHEIYRLAAMNSGADPREFAALVFGGAGPVHAAGFCEAADVSTILVPSFGSVSGAYGTLALQVQQIYEISFIARVAHGGDGGYRLEAVDEINEAVASLIGQARRDLRDEELDTGEVRHDVYLLMRFGQQRHMMSVPLPRPVIGAEDLPVIAAEFASQYAAAYGAEAVFLEAGVEAVGVRVEAHVSTGRAGRLPGEAPSPGPHRKGARPAYWGPGEGWADTPVYWQDRLPADFRRSGPVLVEAEDTVCVVPPGWDYRIDEQRTGWLTRVGAAQWAI